MKQPVIILGLNAFHGDAAAAILRNGEVIAAVAEERLNRIKHASGFPALAVKKVVDMAGIDPGQICAIAVGRDGRAHRWRKLAFVARYRPALKTAILPRLTQRRRIQNAKALTAAALGVPIADLAKTKLINIEHHLAHAASAFWGSSYPRAAILTADGFGDFVSTAWGLGSGTSIDLQQRVFYPHSLGVLYQAVTQFIGFPHYGDEGKTMGLSPYGQPTFVAQLRQMLRLTAAGFELNPAFFTHVRQGVATTWEGATPDVGPLFNERWLPLFGAPRPKGGPQTQREADLAMSVQVVLEEALFHLLDRVHAATGESRLCLAGGVALNCVFNGKIALRSRFKESFVFPAAGDDGLAIGAAWAYWAQLSGQRPKPVSVPLWGPSYPQIKRSQLRLHELEHNRQFRLSELEFEQIIERVAAALAQGKIVGWFKDGAEFGPRALGARSILADPRGQNTKDRLNKRIKHREPFRPFAPAVLAERVADWFEQVVDSPAMLHAIQVRADKRERIPAVTHVDGSGRVQTVAADTHPHFYRLIAAFEKLTGVPILLNTSFNENEPIVCTPQEALDCFLRTDMDLLAMETLLFERV